MRNIAISTIRIDGGTQPRETIDQATVDEYAEAMAALEEFPPLVVYHDGVDTWLADGFHRYHGAVKAKSQTVDVDWREGTLEMAKLYAAGANAAHGKRRTEADRRRAIEMVWSTAEGKRWTQEQIAKHCHVVQQYVSKVLGNFTTGSNSPVRDRKRGEVAAAVAAQPEASDRAIARQVGVDHKTVAKVRADGASASPTGTTASAANTQKPHQSSRAPVPPQPSLTAPITAKVDFANQTQRETIRNAITAIETAFMTWGSPVGDLIETELFAMMRRCGRG